MLHSLVDSATEKDMADNNKFMPNRLSACEKWRTFASLFGNISKYNERNNTF